MSPGDPWLFVMTRSLGMNVGMKTARAQSNNNINNNNNNKKKKKNIVFLRSRAPRGGGPCESQGSYVSL